MPVLEKHDPQSPAVEAPPAYESLNPTHTDQAPTRLINSHSPVTHPPNSMGASPPSLRSTQKSHTRSPSSSSTTSAKGKKSGWFSFASSVSSKTPHEVQSTVLGLVRDLVQDHSSGSPAALGILQSCADACISHSVSFSAILQEKFIENHTPLYWAIVKRANGLSQEDGAEGGGRPEMTNDLIASLLSHISPLNPDTILDLRMACMATSDQAMFQRLRMSPTFSSISGSDRVLLGGSLPPDDITVEIGPSDEGAFVVNCVVAQFHKRMMVSKEIILEFIARNRLWRLILLIIPNDVWYGPPPGSWCISLSLLEPSPPTWLNSRLYLCEPGARTESNTNPSGTESQPQSTDLLLSTPTTDRTFSSQIHPLPPHLKKSTALVLSSKQMMEAPRKGIPATKVIVSMDGSPDFSSLQYSGSSFLAADETLRLRLEAKLTKSNPVEER